jgi:VanZ family protein
LFALSAQPPLLPAPSQPSLVPTDKLAHLGAYGLLAALVLYALRRGHNLPLRRTTLLVILLGAGYGALDEYHQAFVPNRCASLGDWVADVLGVLVVAALHHAYESIRRRTSHR